MNKHYTVVSAAGNHIVLIDQKITFTKVLKAKIHLFAERLSESFESGTVDDYIAAIALTFTFLGVYCGLALL